MTVSAVGQNENSKLYTVVKSTAVGMAGGYALKYLYPVQKQEDNISRRSMLNYCRKVTNRAKADDFRGNGVKSKAQDVFIKMIDSNDKDAFTSKSISAKVKALGGENSVAGKEFRGIIRNVDEMSKSLTRRFTTAYHVMLKIKRPAVPFLVAGAGVGFLTGFAHSVMKTDFDA